jgi:HTH-type transcriptional regulator, bacterioopsin transcriptional activator and related proteins
MNLSALDDKGVFKRIVENSAPIIFVIDKTGIFLLSEGKSLAQIGLKPGQVVGKSVFELYQDYPDIINDVKTAMSGKTARRSVTVKGVNGEVHFDIFYSPLLDQNGSVEAIVGMAVDITEIVSLKNELNRKNTELEALLAAHKK